MRLLAHDANGQRVLAVLGNGLVTRCAYDPDTRRLTRLRTEPMTLAAGVWSPSGAVLQDLTYEWDLVGNVMSIEERVPGCGVAASIDGRDVLVRRFGYDPRYRLTEASGRACADIGSPRSLADLPRCGSLPAAPAPASAPEITAGYRESYTYDPAGNLLDLLYQVTTGTARRRWHRRYIINETSNRLAEVRNGSLASRYRYDDAGNMVAQNSDRQYVWNHAGRLTGVRVGTSVAARYLYGADGRRVKKWVRRGHSAALDESTTYVGTLFEHQRWSKAGGGQHTLLHLLDGARRVTVIRIGPAHPDDAGPTIRYELADHLDSAVLTADDTGSFIRREEYFSYGETSFGSFARKRYRFNGMERDTESGLAYHGARYYHPGLGRWVSPDPAGSVDGFNRYQYARGRPLVMVDTVGTQATEQGDSHAPASTNIVVNEKTYLMLRETVEDPSVLGWEKTTPIDITEINEATGERLQVRLENYGHLQVDLARIDPKHQYFLGMLKEMVQSQQKVLVVEPDDFAGLTHSEPTRRPDGGWYSKEETDLARTVAATKLAAEGLTLAARSIPSHGVTSSASIEWSVIQLRPFYDQKTVAHELFGHFYLLSTGHPWRHDEQLRAEGLPGGAFSGSVIDFITERVEGRLPDKIKDIESRMISKSALEDSLTGKPPPTVKSGIGMRQIKMPKVAPLR